MLKVVTVWRLQGGPPQHPGWPGGRIPISILTVIFQSLVKRHRYAERMEEEVVKLREKRRGLGIDQEFQGTTNQTIGVEEEEEDTVLEHKTIKKPKVEKVFSRRCGQ